MNFVSTWTDRENELLTKWWTEGHTARTISQRFEEEGYSHTKNSVIGRVHRMGLTRDGKLAPKPKKTAGVQGAIRPKLPPHLLQRFIPKRPVLRLTRTNNGYHQEGGFTMNEPKPTSHILLTKTRDHHCRAIVGYRDGQLSKAVCCGEPVLWIIKDGRRVQSSWCAYHRDRFTMEGKKK